MFNFDKVGTSVGRQHVRGSINNTYHFYQASDESNPQLKTWSILEQKAAFRQQCIRSLDFASADDRIYTIETAHTSTCHWLLSSPEFSQWLDKEKRTEHGGFLWIKGKPGTGKSTIMKFVLNIASEDDTYGTLIRFFFHARGDELEKNASGMYRSLLFQLTSTLPELQDVFDSYFVAYRSATPSWTTDVLQTILKKAVVRLRGRAITCLVDALDECYEDDVREMVSFFEHLSEIANTSHVWLRILFSSRHYPYISIRHGVYLILDEQQEHQTDIEIYVDSELNLGEDVPQVQEIRKILLEKASGNFLWVRLVVSMLNASWDKGRLRDLQAVLLCVPSKLELLFDDIVSSSDEQGTSTQRYMEMDLCVRWVLFAYRPLKLEELYWAIITMTEQHADVVRKSQLCSRATMERFVLDCSKGLVEVMKTENETVQFIHETVREYFLSKLQSQIFRSHELLKTNCSNYIENLNRESFDRIEQSSRVSLRIMPFLTYAVKFVYHHSNAAQHTENSQESFLERFNFGKWLAIHKVIFPRRFGIDSVSEGKEEPSQLYVLSDFGLTILLECEAQRVKQLEFGHGNYAYPLLPIIERKDIEALQRILLLQPKTSDLSAQATLQHQARLEDLKRELSGELGPCKWTDRDSLGHSSPWDSANLLTDESPLQYAARRGYRHLTQCLLATGKFSIDRECDEDGYTALMTAAKVNNIDIARLLIEAGASLGLEPTEHRSPLVIASAQGYHLLVDEILAAHERRGVSVRWLTNALFKASENGHKQVVDALIGAGADVNVVSSEGCSVLIMAARNHQVSVVRTLLEYKPNLNYCSNQYGTALLAILEHNTNQMALTTEVLRHGVSAAEFGTATRQKERIFSFIPKAFTTLIGPKPPASFRGRSARYYETQTARTDEDLPPDPAVMGNFVTLVSKGRIEIVSLLLGAGANPNHRGMLGTTMAPNSSGQTPLTLAAMYGYSEEVRTLLQFGADPDTRNSNHATPLILAAREGHTDVVHHLMIAGANLHLSSEITGTALAVAISRGRTDCIKLLRKARAT